jgi:hypothetical protein
MAFPKGFSLPDFLNLGIAPPPPRGANAVATRVHFAPLFRFGDPFPNIPKAFTPLLLPGYFLPVSNIVPGQWFSPNQSFPLLPNPYNKTQSG